MSEEMFEGMFTAQCIWDAAMAHNALKALQRAGGEKAIMVVLIAAIVLLVLSLLDIVPPWDEFKDALPIIYAPVQTLAAAMISS